MSSLLGCTADPGGTELRYRMIGPPAPLPGGGCPLSPVEGPVELPTADSLRLTYLDDRGALLCDAVIDLGTGEPPPVLAFPDTEAPLRLVAEYFASAALVGAGHSPLLSRTERAQRQVPVNVRVTATGAHNCAAARLARARVYHTATRLPGGQVLFVGGAAGLDSEEVVLTGGLYGVAPLELYDPVAQTVTPLAADGFVPRALHHAFVSGGTAAAPEVTLIGGAEVGTPELAPLLTIAGPLDAYRINPGPSSRPAPPVALSIDLAAGTVALSSRAAAGLPPRVGEALAQLADDEFVVAGGLVDAGLTATSSGTLADRAAAPLASFPLLVERVGATLTPLDAKTALLWGGERPDLAAAVREPAEVVFLDAPLRTLPATFMAPSTTPTLRAFHQTARAADGATLLIGGFRVGPTAALEPDPVFVQRATGGPTTFSLEDLALAGGGPPTPLGHTAAIATAQGDVLMSGGSPPLGFGGCPTDRAGLACAVADALIYRAGSDTLESVPALQTARYGHTLTLLADGVILVAGGLTAAQGEVSVVAGLELFDPRDLRDDPLASSELGPRAGGQLASGADGQPLAPCALLAP